MPSVGVFAAIFDEQGRILCVRQNYSPRKWTLPGGKMEARESPFEACLREVKEETGYRVEIDHLIGVYSTPYKDDVVISFACHIVGRDAWQPNNEIAEIGFFGRETLPRPMRQRTLVRIHDAFDGLTNVVRVFKRETARKVS
jgi:ADP-ribose pyrophosphatase YjhB (NUDIX family)